MSSLSTVQILIGLLAAKAAAQASPVRLCTTEACDNCPNAVLSTEPTDDSDLPCVVYDRETVLGGSAGDYQPILSGHRDIWFDITPTDDCLYVIRTPADPEDPKCGSTVKGPSEPKCLQVVTQSSFAVQKCCGTVQCSKIGAKVGARQGASGYTNLALRNIEGDLIVPASVGGGPAAMDKFLESHGLKPSDVITERSSSGHMVFKKRSVPEVALGKRDCVFNKNGDVYEASSLETQQISNRLCYDTSPTFTETASTTVGWSTTFSAGINIEVFSAGVDFTIEESATHSKAYALTVPENQCGHFAFTGYMLCQKGSVAGCDGGDAEGEVCTAKRLASGEIEGDYTFVET